MSDIDRPTIDRWVDEVTASTFDQSWNLQVPIRFRNATVGALPPEVRDPIVRWAAAWQHDSPEAGALILCGPVGTGKTYAAVAAARELEVPLFCPVVELLDALRPGGDMTTLSRGQVSVTGGPLDLAYHKLGGDVRSGLLLLDDLGAERPTEWTAERLYAIVNRRWMDAQPTIVTTNSDPARFAETFGARIFSRLADGAVVVRLGGEDRRRGA